MRELIEKHDAIDALIEEFKRTPTVAIRAKHTVEKLPSAQPDIIACGDCKHWICHDRRCGYWNHGVKPLDWCSHAERRENEADS